MKSSRRLTTAPSSDPVCGRCHKAPPCIACQCDMDVQFCRNCYGAHIMDDDGEHKPQPLTSAPRSSLPASLKHDPELAGQDSNCTKCDSTASEICTCQHPVIFLCGSCIDEHIEGLPEREHITVPVSAAPHLTTRESLGRLKRRCNQLEQAEAKLQKVLSNMGQAEDDIMTMLDTLALRIEETKAKKSEEISRQREELRLAAQTALEEVRSHAWEEDYKGSTMLADQLFRYRENDSDALMNIFQWNVRLEKAQQGLDQAISVRLKLTDSSEEERKEYAMCLPIVNSTSLRLFNVETRQTGRCLLLSEPVCINETSTWLIVGSSVIASGRMYPLSASVYDISLENGLVVSKQPMRVARYFHAMVYYARTKKYYVFGGTGGVPERFQSCCEVYDCLLETWTDTPGSLREGRDCFNPVQMEEKFFIIGGRNAKSVELFSTITEAFTQTLVTLPAATSTLAVQDDGDILILQRDKAIRWKPMTTELKSVTIKDGLHMFSNTVPLRIGNEIFILRCVNSGVCTVTVGRRNEPVLCTKTPFIY